MTRASLAYSPAVIVLIALCVFNAVSIAAEPQAVRPTMAEFMGVNGHTVLFKPELYKQVCRKVRDYHSFEWDVGKETDFKPNFPEARNRVNWDHVYGSWKDAGFENDVCVMFNNTPPDSWKDLGRDARAYGVAFAKAFGPSSEKQLVSSVEIGNEPGHYSDEQYRTLFQSMADGLREGDPKLKIVTCNMTTGKSGRYEKSVECIAGLNASYDVLSIHSYAMAEGWPTWKRSYPEDPKIEFLKSIQSLIDWRDEHAKDKPVWVTEFGWDASTKPRHTTGEFAKWEGNVSDQRQAQYLVRAFLVFAGMDIERAYLYFFNDSNEPSYHASSGITRDFQPKPSFHAISHLYRTLEDYRFHREILKRTGEIYAYEFVHAETPRKRIVVAWSPTGSDRSAEATVPVGGRRLVRAVRMPLTAGEAPVVETRREGDSVRFNLDESPLYLWLEE